MASPIVLEHQCLLGLREKVVKLVLLANLAGLGLFSFSLLVVIFYIYYVQIPLNMVLVQLPKHLVCNCLIWLVNLLTMMTASIPSHPGQYQIVIFMILMEML